MEITVSLRTSFCRFFLNSSLNPVRIAALLAAALFSASAPASESPTIAFTHANVVPMSSDRVLHDQTVVIEHGRIAAVGSSATIPAGARVIDARGAFLSPGLADMHTHADTAAAMKVYLANGVTTVLNMGDASSGFITQTRPAVNEGRRPGPHVYAGFLVDGSPEYGHVFVTTPDEARALVRLAKTNGYDFIKVYNNLSPECFAALIDEGKRQGLAVIGHGVTRVGLEKQLDAGQVMVAHTEEFLYTTFAESARRADPGDPNAAPDPAVMPAAIAFILRDHAFVTADINTYATIAEQWGKPGMADAYLKRPESRYVDPDVRISWQHAGYARRKGSIDARVAFLRRFTKALADAGVPLIAGTDAPSIPGIAPGFSLHDDLAALEASGLTRYQSLATATRTPGEFIARNVPGAEPFGTIEVGRRADLVLSRANPLADLATLRKPLGVMANGHWYTRADLDALRDEVTTDYAAAVPH